MNNGRIFARRRAAACLVVVCALVTTSACTSRTPASQPTPSSNAANPATSSPATSPSRPPATPPPAYEPADPSRTRMTAQGFPVNACVPPKYDAQVFSLTASDGAHLPALELGSGDRGILLDHESGYTICSWLDLAEQLASKGYHVLLFEYRGHGASQKSDKPLVGFGKDTTAALAELHLRGAKSVLIGGASCGGTMAAIAASTEAQLVGLLILSSPSACDGDAVPAIRKVTKPTLIAVSADEFQGNTLKEDRKLFAASSAPDKHLEIVPGERHGTDNLRDPATKDALGNQILAFVDRCFKA